MTGRLDRILNHFTSTQPLERPRTTVTSQQHPPTLEELRVAPAAGAVMGTEAAPPPALAAALPQIGKSSAEFADRGAMRIADRTALEKRLDSMLPFRPFRHHGKLLERLGSDAAASRGAAFESRCAKAGKEEKQRLAEFLHYSGTQAAVTPPDVRLTARAAVVLAYANNASLEQLDRLRGTIEKASPSLRQTILRELHWSENVYREITLEKIEPEHIGSFLDELTEANRPPANDDLQYDKKTGCLRPTEKRPGGNQEHKQSTRKLQRLPPIRRRANGCAGPIRVRHRRRRGQGQGRDKGIGAHPRSDSSRYARGGKACNGKGRAGGERIQR